ARTYIYTTASPPALAHALLAAIDIIEQESWRRQRLEELVAQLRKRLHCARWKLLPSTTPIQPLMIGASKDALELAARLERAGILVPAIRPPTVPRGTARLRISLSAAHCAADVDRLADALLRAERQAA
ncbi:MAG: aminotransferase class I/II-fold pyridoxal phosphate-dependent enzyme, partial [Burkholderiales bacterium]